MAFGADVIALAAGGAGASVIEMQVRIRGRGVPVPEVPGALPCLPHESSSNPDDDLGEERDGGRSGHPGRPQAVYDADRVVAELEAGCP